MYFTPENAGRIDASREELELWRKAEKIDENSYYLLLAAIIEGADRVANTAGVAVTFGGSGIPLSGGAGGGNGTGAGGAITGAGLVPTIAGGVGTTGGVGNQGFMLGKRILFDSPSYLFPHLLFTGGSGGGGHGTGQAGAGGDGGYGCGGGGGGGSQAAGGVRGAGGRGGDGLIIIGAG